MVRPILRCVPRRNHISRLLSLGNLPVRRRLTFDAARWAGDDDFLQTDDGLGPLVALEEAILAYPNSESSLGPWDVAIYPPTTGGHAVLGRNGAGKSLLATALISNGNSDIVRGGNYETEKGWHSRAIANVSFESHESLLLEGGTTYKAISGGGGNLSKAAQFLIVRFGLFSMLHRDVNTLSTGEIRKVMLVRALANRPRLLVLDNAFDGLDVSSRQKLGELVSKTIAGFRPDILVQGVSARATAHTQVVLITHREEEIVDEIEAITMWDEEGNLRTLPRRGQNGGNLMQKALGTLVEEKSISHLPWDDPQLPSIKEIAAFWQSRKRPLKRSSPTVVEATNLTVRRGETALLDNVSWTVRRAQRWLVAGGNGAGKSSLSRLLAKEEDGVVEGILFVAVDGVSLDLRRPGVGWVSTELHMETARSTLTVQQVLEGKEGSTHNIAASVASWLGFDDPHLLSRPFSTLSQGQQKLVLIGAAIACRPEIIVMDEPCQGLDIINRHRVLGLIERVCRATDTSLVYITHHLEELLPSVTHVLHMVNGKAVYIGSREDYDPDIW